MVRNNVYLFETNSKELFISAVNHKRARVIGRVYQPRGRLFISKLYGTTTNCQEGIIEKKEKKMSENKIKLPTEKQFEKYLKVQKRGNHNMFFPQARKETGLSRDVYKAVMSNYSELMEKYPDKYKEIMGGKEIE